MYGVHQDYGIKGKSIIVTGAASGVGRSTVLLLADLGANVTASDVNDSGLKETAALAKGLAGKVQTIKADICSENDIKAMVAFAVDGFGQLNGAANVAGVGSSSKPMMDMGLDEVRKMAEINMIGVWCCLKYEIAAMLKSGGGPIVNVSSMAALQGFPNASQYAAPKAGTIAMMRPLLHDFGRQGIRINTICPGPIDTPMFRDSIAAFPEVKDQVIAMTKVGHMAHPDEVGYVIRFLLSNESSYVTGSTIIVEGGISA